MKKIIISIICLFLLIFIGSSIHSKHQLNSALDKFEKSIKYDNISWITTSTSNNQKKKSSYPNYCLGKLKSHQATEDITIIYDYDKQVSYLINKKNKTITINKLTVLYNQIAQNGFHEHNITWEKLLKSDGSLKYKKMERYNKVNCYVIELTQTKESFNFGSQGTKYGIISTFWISEKTGMIQKVERKSSTNNSSVTLEEYEITLDNVTESDVALPDFSQYKVTDNS